MVVLTVSVPSERRYTKIVKYDRVFRKKKCNGVV